jgi:hypothetical protein
MEENQLSMIDGLDRAIVNRQSSIDRRCLDRPIVNHQSSIDRQ